MSTPAVAVANEQRYPPISDYALIGDCRSVALISRAGSIDWCCLPRFDSPSYFGALLDRTRGGCFAIAPVRPFTVTRRYRGPTNVLETTFTTDTGVLRLTDFVPVTSEEEKKLTLDPENEVIRIAECTEGSVEFALHCDPRPQYGRVTPSLRLHGALGYVYEHRSNILALRSEMVLEAKAGVPGVFGRETLEAGESCATALAFTQGEPAAFPPLGDIARKKLDRTLRWWEEWARRCSYQGPYRDAVLRSALTLKLLTFAPSGALIAAPTTSLPEWPGGVRNWDYRYCWLRDASLTLKALLDLDYDEEAGSFLSWLLHATRLTRPELQVLYDVYGESDVPERELDYLEGYGGSRPVRVGNGAAKQLQLDVYGEVIDAALRYVKRHGPLDRMSARMIAGFSKTVCDRWREPDAGLWEPRSGSLQHTVSKAMCWVALDRTLELCEIDPLPIDRERITRERDAIRAAIEAHGYSERLGSYVAVFDSEELDAALLLLIVHGYIRPDSARSRGTLRAIVNRLGTDGLLRRYTMDDGLPPHEGAFLLCCFWGAQVLALQGETEEARQRFEFLLGLANDVGLFAEEIDPRTRALLGNFPQAYTHVGLINAAVLLERCSKQSALNDDQHGHAA